MNTEERLGELKAGMTHVSNNVEKLLVKVDHINDQTILQKQSLKSAHKRIDTIEPKVNNHEKIKNKGIGIVFASVVFGAGLGWIGKMLLKVVL